MPDSTGDILDALRAGPDVFVALLAGCSEEEARTARGGDENWSVVEVVCHLRDAEERAVERTTAMLNEPRPELSAYDQEAWARDRNYAAADLQGALAGFIEFRRQHLAALEGRPPSDWQREGVHEETGPITVHSHAIHMAAHDAIHAAQVGRQLQSARG